MNGTPAKFSASPSPRVQTAIPGALSTQRNGTQNIPIEPQMPGLHGTLPPAFSQVKTLLVKSKMRRKAVLHTMLEGQRDRDYVVG
jgi:hypothetical protein